MMMMMMMMMMMIMMMIIAVVDAVEYVVMMMMMMMMLMLMIICCHEYFLRSFNGSVHVTRTYRTQPGADHRVCEEVRWTWMGAWMDALDE